jgi:hypothetical protein
MPANAQLTAGTIPRTAAATTTNSPSAVSNWAARRGVASRALAATVPELRGHA